MISMLYEKFKEWSDSGSIYIISDTHFEDSDCKLMDPNWITPEQHIHNINSVVSKNDTLICLGDCGNPEWFDKIKAKRKILIKGNHDAGTSKYQSKGYMRVYPEDKYTLQEAIKEFKSTGMKFIDASLEYDMHAPFVFYQVWGYTGYFDEVYEGPLTIAPKIILSHEPLGDSDYWVNIHGHCHDGKVYKNGVNITSNVYGFKVFNLGKEIKNGLVSNVQDIHRITINQATYNKEVRENGINK